MPGPTVTPDEFRRLGHALVDWVADYRATIADRPVRAQVRPGALRAALPASAPEQPEPFTDVVADLDRLVAPALTSWQHPSFFAYFPANAMLASVLGDIVSSGVGNVGLSWEASPALTELEEVAVDWLRRLFGLDDGWHGTIQDTASTATLLALLVARERSSGMSHDAGGLQAAASPLVVYTSAQSHSSVAKAALLAGFGRDNVRLVAAGTDHSMDPADLARAVALDRAAGRIPCAVVVTVGSTAITACDPIRAVATVARESGAYLHVDGALAGSALILPECRSLFDGIELADSLVINPHKWLGVAFDCSPHFVRDVDLLLRVLSTSPSYLASFADGEVANLRDRGIPLGRRARAFKIWLLLRLEGAESLRARLRRDIANASWLAAQVEAAPGWQVVAPVSLQNGVRPARAARSRRSGPRYAHAVLVRRDQRLRRGVSDARATRRLLDGSRLDRRRADRAGTCRRALGADAGSGALHQLDPVAVGIAHEADSRAAGPDRVGRPLRLDPQRREAGQRLVEVVGEQGDVAVSRSRSRTPRCGRS